MLTPSLLLRPMPRVHALTIALAVVTHHAFGQAPVTPAVDAATSAAQSKLVLTPSRSIQSLDTVLATTHVITRSAIESAGALSLPDLLRRYANIESIALGGAGQPAGLIGRGGAPNQFLVLVDGLRFSDGGASEWLAKSRGNSAPTGIAALEHVPLAAIERIEVVSGNMASLYGSGAAAGVVSIITRAGFSVGDTAKFSASGGVGNEGRREAHMHMATSEGPLKFALTLGHVANDGGSATDLGAPTFSPDRDPYRNTYAALRVTQQMSNGEVFTLNAWHNQARVATDAGPDPVFGFRDERIDRKLSGVQLSSATFYREYWRMRLDLGSALDESKADGRTASTFKSRQDTAALVNEFGIVGGKVIAGLEAKREKVSSDRPFEKNSRVTKAGFVALRQRYEGLLLDLNVRRDDIEDEGAYSSADLGVGYNLSSVGLVYAKGGRGFRAPSMAERYAPPIPLASAAATNSPVLLANNNLKIETSLSREIGVRRSGENYRANVSLFDQQFNDLIAPTAAQGGLRYQNVREASARGIEFSGDYAWQGYRFALNLTVQKARDESAGDRLPGRSERFGNVWVTRDFGDWSLGGGLTFVGDRIDSGSPSGERLPAYTLLNAYARAKLARHWSIELVGNNLGDKRYETVRGYPVGGAAVQLNVRVESP